MSVISRMLQDLESRGAPVPVSRPVPDWVAEADRAALVSENLDAEPKSRSWPRTVLLPSVLLAGGAVFYGIHGAEWLPSFSASHASTLPARVSTPSTAAKASAAVNAISAFRMDWTLSLGMIKPKMHHPFAAVSLPPKQEVEGDMVDTSEHADSAPPHLETESTQPAAQGPARIAPLKVTSINIIDPPSAGRLQSSANQAVEAYRRALDLAEQGRDGVALDTALQAIKLDAQHMPARRLAIALALDQKQVDQAGALIDEGLQLAPRDGELLFLHARRLALAGANEQALGVLAGLDRPTGESLGLKAGLLARTGQYAPAAQAYQQALKTRPDNATWWLGLGVAWNAQGQGAMAKEAFLRARKLGQLSPDVQAWLDQQL